MIITNIVNKNLMIIVISTTINANRGFTCNLFPHSSCMRNRWNWSEETEISSLIIIIIIIIITRHLDSTYLNDIEIDNGHLKKQRDQCCRCDATNRVRVVMTFDCFSLASTSF